MATFHPLHISPNTTKSAQEAWRLKQGVVDVDGTSRNCTLVDMTSVDFRKPASFTLCTELVGGVLMVKNPGGWQVVEVVYYGYFYILQLNAFVDGIDFGYTIQKNLHLSTVVRKVNSWSTSYDTSPLCH